MANFGKLNFQVALNPTTAFPVDARCYFEGEDALTAARAAAATAEDVGSKNTVYHYGMKILVNQNGVYTWYKITTSKTLVLEASGGGDPSDDTTITDSDFATDEEVEEMLNKTFG